jgi:hypothetical protein
VKTALLLLGVGAAAAVGIVLFLRRTADFGTQIIEGRPLDEIERRRPEPFFARIATERSDPPQQYAVEVANNEDLGEIRFQLRLRVHNISPFGTGNGDGTPFNVTVPPLTLGRVVVNTGVRGSPLSVPALWRAQVLDSTDTVLDSVTRIGV